MRRSKLEIYFEILQVLAFGGPLKLTHIMYKGNINCGILKRNLNYLVKKDLVEERSVENQRVVFAITHKGRALVTTFKELLQLLPLTDKTNNSTLFFS